MRFNNLVLGTIFSIFLFFGATVNTSAQTDDPILKACEQTADRLKQEEIKNAGLESEVKLLREMLTLKDEKIANVSEQREFFKKAYENSTKIDTNSSMVIDNLRVQVNDYRRELTELRAENDKLRSSRTMRTILGFGAGLATGYFTKK
jgi:predicted RNase H-like nuclease (RuvC/YqgF family)